MGSLQPSARQAGSIHAPPLWASLGLPEPLWASASQPASQPASQAHDKLPDRNSASQPASQLSSPDGSGQQQVVPVAGNKRAGRRRQQQQQVAAGGGVVKGNSVRGALPVVILFVGPSLCSWNPRGSPRGLLLGFQTEIHFKPRASPQAELRPGRLPTSRITTREAELRPGSPPTSRITTRELAGWLAGGITTKEPVTRLAG